MAIGPYQLGYIANIALAAFLILLAVFVARKLGFAGRRWFATYLVLVGLNYGLDGIHRMFYVPALQRAGFLATLLDPAPLMLFALSLRRGTRTWVKIAVALPSLFLAVYAVSQWPVPDEGFLRRLTALVFVPYYLIALTLAAAAHHASRSASEQDLRARLVVALAVILLSRIPLLFVDVGIVHASVRHFMWTIFYLEVPLVVLTIVAGAFFLWTAPPSARSSARGALIQAGFLLALVDAVWLFRLVPGFNVGSFAILYSFRWFVFAGLVTYDLRRYELLGVPARVGTAARGIFATLLTFLVFIQFAAMFATGSGVPTGLAWAAVATLPLAIGAAVVFWRQAATADTRRLRVYRAHADLGASPAELSRLREELGLTLSEAREEERLIALEARAPPAGLGRPTVGAVFARRYDVSTIIGSGTFGLVYDAFDRVEGRRVVLKELRPDWRATPAAAAQFRQEAQAALRVSNPHLVRMLSVERAADGHVLVLEHVEGVTLRERMGRGPLASKEASKLAADVLDALSSLHGIGILHRDVKPENVIIRPSGDAVLIDLGAASATESRTIAAGGPHPGTPAYMSPEQKGGARIDATSDLYSLGAALWEALAAAPPGGGKVPEPWRYVLERALAQDPAQRFPDAAAFRAALP